MRLAFNGGTGHSDNPILDAPRAISDFAAANGLPAPFPSVRYPLQPGQYHPRVWRTPGPPIVQQSRRELISAESSTRFVYEMLGDIFDVVEPHPSTTESFGHRMRHFLILACTEIEASWAGVLTANGYLGDRWTTRDYVKLLKPMRLSEWRVRLSMFPDYPELQPFGGWDAAYPTETLPFYEAYHAVKHNREVRLNQARLDHAINAAAAMYIMALAQFGRPSQGANGVFKAYGQPQWKPEEYYYPPGENAVAWGSVNITF